MRTNTRHRRHLALSGACSPKPERITTPSRTRQVPMVTHFAAAWRRLYVSGSRISPIHPRMLNSIPIPSKIMPAQLLIESLPLQMLGQRHGADETENGPGDSEVDVVILSGAER